MGPRRIALSPIISTSPLFVFFGSAERYRILQKLSIAKCKSGAELEAAAANRPLLGRG
jgi:hypothetical protein